MGQCLVTRSESVPRPEQHPHDAIVRDPGGAGHVDLPDTRTVFSKDIEEVVISSSSDLDICQVRRYPQEIYNGMKVFFCHQAVQPFQKRKTFGIKNVTYFTSQKGY